MDRWMAAFPNPTNPDREDDEVIYEDWGENYSDATAVTPFDPSFLMLSFFWSRLSSGPVCGTVHRPAD